MIVRVSLTLRLLGTARQKRPTQYPFPPTRRPRMAHASRQAFVKSAATLIFLFVCEHGRAIPAPPVQTCSSVPWTCHQGWVCKDTPDGPECVDYDECVHGTHDCENACINTPGSYICLDYVLEPVTCANWQYLCAPGYECQDTLEGPQCVDINECTAGTDSCEDNQLCVNIDGSYLCMNGPQTCANWGQLCKSGYECVDKFTGPECVDVNECARETDDCEGPCINTEGSYMCLETLEIETCATVSWICHYGYVCQNLITGPECVDVNECTEGTHECPPDSMCLNRKGSYTCLEQYVPPTCATVDWICKQGFQCVEGNPPECVDINECMNGTADCDPGTRCVNYAGGYVCVQGN